MRRIDSSKRTLLFYYIVAVIVASVNVLFCYNKEISYLAIIIEIVVLVYELINKRIYRYTALSVIFISNCLEFSYFVGKDDFYNMKTVRILGINIGAWVLLVLAVICCIKPIRTGIIKQQQHGLFRFGTNLIKLNVVAAVVGFVLLLVNDNNIAGVGNIENGYVSCAYAMLFIPLTELLAIFYIVGYEKEHIKELYIALQATAFANACQIIVSFCFGLYGYYGGTGTLLVSTTNFLSPMMLLILFDKKSRFRKTSLIIIIIGIILSIAFNANGKLVLLIVFVSIIALFKLLKGRKMATKIATILIVVLGAVLIPFIIEYLINNNVLFNSKYSQVLTLFQFGKENWIQNLAQSPRARVEEFFDVCLEFANSPWLIFTGKGYMGSIIDRTGYFSTLSTNRGMFSDAEWINGTYYNLHEVTSSLLLYGIMGIAYTVSLIKYGIKNSKTNAWAIMGIFWFVFLYGYSFTLSCFGAMAFFVGLLSNSDNQVEAQ